jgi:hypothetical protein
LKAIAQEIAKMSYSGRLGGVVMAGTKKVVEKYFIADFPIQDIWDKAGLIRRTFYHWHKKRVHELGQVEVTDRIEFVMGGIEDPAQQ